MDKIKLTALSHGAGCACKMDAEKLSRILQSLPAVKDKHIIAGISPVDDACVYDMGNGTGIVSTVDFFTPIVDDPFHFGQIAAANALSDIYAMGGRPISALNIVCFPEKKLPHEILQEILKGGAEKAKEAGIAIAGGHTIDDAEPKYGLCVTGTVNIKEMMTTGGAKSGESIILTKPIGTGIYTTAIKRDSLDSSGTALVVATMSKLNKNACEIAVRHGVRGCTDVTGFGLIGHLGNLVKGSRVHAEIFLSHIPTLEGAVNLAEKGFIPGGLLKNRNFYSRLVDIAPDISAAEAALLFDPQTSGGLLFGAPEEKTGSIIKELEKSGYADAAVIGRFVDAGHDIIVRR